jgi:predicted nucleic acid-binding Zn ribbon protein
VSTWRDQRPPALEIDPRRVGEHLDRATQGLGLPKAGILGVLFSKWADLVGTDIAAHTEPRTLRDGVLLVAVDQPAWAAQLRYLASDLVQKIAVFTGSSDVTDIQFRVVASAGSEAQKKSPNRHHSAPD